jgi:hypothetical protein
MRILFQRLAMCAIIGVALVLAARAMILRGGNVPADGERANKPASKRFVVHEWGTFTSFSGSDSVKLEFRPLEDVDLPGFVLNRARQTGNFPFLLLKRDITAQQRMETPVTYFYSEEPLQARVRVVFPRGLLTEFYPPVADPS